jgi:hypothetical protein
VILKKLRRCSNEGAIAASRALSSFIGRTICQEDAMKLRARATIDVDCGGHLEDQEFEKRIQTLVTELGQEFGNVQYDIKRRREPPVRRSR